MVYETSIRDDFCRTWTALDLAPPDDPCVPQGPTASSYAAYATATKRLKHTYKLSDKATYGYRNIFLRLTSPYRFTPRFFLQCAAATTFLSVLFLFAAPAKLGGAASPSRTKLAPLRVICAIANFFASHLARGTFTFGRAIPVNLLFRRLPQHRCQRLCFSKQRRRHRYEPLQRTHGICRRLFRLCRVQLSLLLSLRRWMPTQQRYIPRLKPSLFSAVGV